MSAYPPLVIMQPSNGGLAVARAVARRGVSVEVLATPSDAHTARTRLARGRVLPTFADDPRAWFAALGECARRGPAVVLAGSDEATDFLARERDRIPSELTTFESQDDVHLDLMDKPRSHELATAAGVRVPWTQVARNEEDVERAIAGAPYPNVLKPVLSHVWRPLLGQERVLLAHTPDELRAHARRALDAGLDVIVSEYVPGGDDCVEEAILVRAADGSFPMQFGCAKLRQSPHGFGAASLCMSAELRESLAMARTLLAHTGFVGVAGIETKRHAETGDFYFIEANVRLPTQFGLGDASRVEASWRTYATLAGIELGPQPPQRNGVKLVFPELDLKEVRRHARGERSADRPDSWVGWLRSWSGTRELGVLDLRDPGPALELARGSLRRRLGATRPS
jgi:predicted ATP-grasp superfamily ATP-dependent carboligase